ncbi:MAG: hypothetical protein ABI797_03050 [Chloroflexota bacterium]
MEEADVRLHADAFCAALLAGDIGKAAEELSKELHANLGQVVAMLPMPLKAAEVESAERTASGMRLVLHLTGDTEETQLETRWKERDGMPVIVEVSHLAATPVAPPAESVGGDEGELAPEQGDEHS